MNWRLRFLLVQSSIAFFETHLEMFSGSKDLLLGIRVGVRFGVDGYKISNPFARYWVKSSVVHGLAEKGNRVSGLGAGFACNSARAAGGKHDAMYRASEQTIRPVRQ